MKKLAYILYFVAAYFVGGAEPSSSSSSSLYTSPHFHNVIIIVIASSTCPVNYVMCVRLFDKYEKTPVFNNFLYLSIQKQK